ncbi:Rossmann-fold NAD(P)-binding domain-containing protein [Streptomyces tubercidicus]|uniref:hypothetical protein n=1 Tax=Streptomyces tubercidicus TaxID=47759 RepID=UPI003680A9EA
MDEGNSVESQGRRSVRVALSVGCTLSLTHRQRAEAIGAVIGRPVRYEETPPEEARQMMLRAWLADAVLANMALQVTEPEAPSPDFERITGHPPRAFRAWVTDHADAFR